MFQTAYVWMDYREEVRYLFDDKADSQTIEKVITTSLDNTMKNDPFPISDEDFDFYWMVPEMSREEFTTFTIYKDHSTSTTYKNENNE